MKGIVVETGGAVIALLGGDCREVLPTLEALGVQCCVTSPPYWGLRDWRNELRKVV